MDLNLRVGFSTSLRSPISAMIRALSESKCSHTFLVYTHPYYKQDMVVEACEWGIRESRYTWFAENNHMVSMWTLNPTYDYSAGMTWLGDQLEKEYDFLGLFGMVPVALARRLHKKIKNPLHQAKSMFCSEMVTAFLNIVQYPNFSTMVPLDTEPQDLLSRAETVKEPLSWFGATP